MLINCCCFDLCMFAKEITNYNAHTLEGWNNINIIRYFIFKVKNLNMLGSKTLERAHGLLHTQIVTHF